MKRFTILIFALLIVPSVFAEQKPFKSICNKAETKIQAAKHVTYSRSLARFKDTYDDIYYRGCVLTLAGIITSEPDYYKILMSRI